MNGSTEIQYPEKVLIMVRKALSRALDLSEDVSLDSASIDSLAAWSSLKHISVIEEVESVMGRNLNTDEILAVTSFEAIAQLLFKESKLNESILDQ